MYKRNTIVISILILFRISAFGQDEKANPFFANSRVELLGTYEPFGGGLGTIAKGKKQILNSKHFEGFLGLAFQFSHQSETDKYLTGVDGYNNDIGIYIVSDLVYYPLKTKNIFIGLEPFIGLTNLKSKGGLEISQYDIYEKYSNSYTYINYGITPTIGYNFGKLSVSFFSMISLKGFLDKGRTRLGDSDSKIFFGISLSYKLKPME